ncbi:uncharacterized protein LOC134183991 [Corticium candelabrum]|uniref:uncharacterized protein LOC134183991 n=1 Tax=Corticium candelabrum TaxID=121492 RepID=UPI002E2540C8|nr:uncharacterized protein LOC134183991 [Corticium candelabrum]
MVEVDAASHDEVPGRTRHFVACFLSDVTAGNGFADLSDAFLRKGACTSMLSSVCERRLRKHREQEVCDRYGNSSCKKYDQLLLAHAARLSRLSLDMQMFPTDELDEVQIEWKPVRCAAGGGIYVNRLVAVNTGLIACSDSGDELFMANNSVEEWKTLPVTSHFRIVGLAALDGECFSIMRDRRSSDNKVANFDVKTSTWRTAAAMTFEGVWQLVANESSLYLIGNRQEILNRELQVYEVDINEGGCHHLGSVEIEFLVVSAVAIGDNIYMSGKSSSVRVLSLADFSMKSLPNMSNRNCSILNFGGRLVALGGIDSNDGAASAAVEIFHPRVNKWLALPPMTCRRVGHGVCRTNDYSIAVVGGMDVDITASAETLHV